MAKEIPIVDLSAFTSGGDLESRKQAARDFAEKCHPTGCIGISGHGVPADMLEKAFQVSKKLFSLPYEEKYVQWALRFHYPVAKPDSDRMKAPHPKAFVPHRGYSGIGTEKGGIKTAAETDDKDLQASILKASDYKVCGVWLSLHFFLTSLLRRAMKSAVRKIRYNTIFGCPRTCYLDSVNSRLNSFGPWTNYRIKFWTLSQWAWIWRKKKRMAYTRFTQATTTNCDFYITHRSRKRCSWRRISDGLQLIQTSRKNLPRY